MTKTPLAAERLVDGALKHVLCFLTSGTSLAFTIIDYRKAGIFLVCNARNDYILKFILPNWLRLPIARAPGLNGYGNRSRRSGTASGFPGVFWLKKAIVKRARLFNGPQNWYKIPRSLQFLKEHSSIKKPW